MAEKESESTVSKLKRKFSRKSTTKVPSLAAGITQPEPATPPANVKLSTPPVDVKSTIPPANVKSTTVPANVNSTNPPANVKFIPPVNVKSSTPPVSVKLTTPPGNVKLTTPPGNMKLTTPPGNVKSSTPPVTVKSTTPPGNVRSATLPLASDPKTLAYHEPHGEGLFSKIRRRFRFGSKGKYDFKSVSENSPSKPRWLRRKSEEAQLHGDGNGLTLSIDPRNAVGKSNSVKTQRKSKSDKEEVILIRKDKKVSVICKAENGEPEVIFSNVDNPDEDLSEAFSEKEEDPYATIRSVKEEITQKQSRIVVANRQTPSEDTCKATANNIDADKSNKVSADMDEYPYARIDRNRKKQLALSSSSLEVKTSSKQSDVVRVTSLVEPDYETLDEVRQRKSELMPQGNTISSSCGALETGPVPPSSPAPSCGLEPDYESLEEVKQRCGHSNLSSTNSHLKHPALACINSAYQSLEQSLVQEPSGVGSSFSHSGSGSETSSRGFSPLLGSSTDGRRYHRTPPVSSSQGSRPASMPSPHLGGRTPTPTPSPSPSALAPLAPTVDSSLPFDAAAPPSASPQEECIYDNPNILLRKQVSRSSTNASTLPRLGLTHSEIPVIKTPAEEELVEKLSALLAPPLPLRNYQKDEVFSRSFTGSARHSWSSQGSRHADSGEFIQVKDADKSPITSCNHSRENLAMKSGKDTHVNQGSDRYDLFSRSNGTDTFRKIETGSLERYLRKASPKTVKPYRLLEIGSGICKSDYSPIDKVNKNIDTNILVTKAVTGEVNSVQRKEVNFSAETTSNLEVVDFCQELARSVVEEAIKQCSCSETLCVHPSSENATNGIAINNLASTLKNMKAISGQPSQCLQINKTADSYQSEFKHRNGSELNKNCENGPIVKAVTTSNPGDDLYMMQGARPKVKPLLLDTTSLSSSDLLRYPVKLKSIPQGNSNVAGQSKSGVDTSLSSKLIQNMHTRNKASPDLHEENITGPKKPYNGVTSDRKKKSEEEYNKKYLEGADSSIQETVYVDSGSENESGLEVNEQVTVHVKRNQCISKVAKPVVYANPRLVENIISGAFKVKSSLDPAYLAQGVFRWGRYFPYLNKNRQAVETKLKSFLNFVLEMILNPSRLEKNQPKIQKLQEEVDRLQLKIEKRLRTVQDLPTFQDIRLMLLKSEGLDNWEPEKPAESYFSLPESHKNAGRSLPDRHVYQRHQHPPEYFIQDEPSLTDTEREFSKMFTNKQMYSDQDLDVGDTFHSDESFSEVDEVFGAFDNGQSLLNLPSSPSEVLDEFIKLSRSRLKCKYCPATEDSDSEDEMITVETYSRTVSASYNSRFANQTDLISAGSLCRSFYGELAYTSYMRQHRPSRKLLNVSGPDDDCGGSESHLSWNSWCCMDALLKKLVPHISPRLDFQYLLRTYAEFKHFILIDRKRNLEHKGCFMKKFPPHGLKCCRFEEFVFLKVIRDEIRHFSHVFLVSEASRNLFLEERDVGFSMLSLLKLVLQNIHKMCRSMSKEEVGGLESKDTTDKNGQCNHKILFRHSTFQRWPMQEDYFLEPKVGNDQQGFHIGNFENFRFGTLSLTLRNWKSPNTYVHDPNVLDSCRSMIAQSDPRILEFAGIKGVEEPRPLQEQQDFLESMEQLQLKDWYWGPISYEQATLILKDKEDGSFLVRDSSDQKYLLSLSFKSLGEVHHTRIEHAKGLFSFWSQPESHGKARICEFIEKSIQNSRDGRFLYFLRPSARGTPPLPIRLLTPVSRNFRVATLKHLSRFVVRQSVRKDHLDLLPVPEKVKKYLKDKQYYVEILDDDQWAFDGDYGKS